jgi:hypothetical protein
LSKRAPNAAVSAGGVATGAMIFVAVTALLGFLAVMWGIATIVIQMDGNELKVEGPDDRSRHPLAGIRDIVVDKAYRSLRVRYADGSNVQTAKLGVGVKRLEELAVGTQGMIRQA